jgi:hypothetical protein
MLESSITLVASASSDPWMQSKIMPETWIRLCPVRCCLAIAHTPISPPSLNSRCSAFGCALGAPFNGQAIDAGRHAAVFYRNRHLNEHPLGGTKIRHAEEPVSAAGAALRSHCLWPSHACSRHKLLAPGRQRATRVSLPTTSSEITRKIRPEQPEHAISSPLIL